MSKAEKMLLGRRRAVLAGKFGSGPAPYGYERDEDAYLHVVESEAQVVRLIFREYLRLRSVWRLVALLDERGVQTRKGNKWTRAGLAYLLRNEVYRGLVRTGRTTVRGRHEAIVAPIAFNLANQLLKTKRRRPPCEGVLEPTGDPRAARARKRQEILASAYEVRRAREAAIAAAREAREQRRAAKKAERERRKHPLFSGGRGRSLLLVLDGVDDQERIKNEDGWVAFDRWVSLSGSRTQGAAERKFERVKARLRQNGIEVEVGPRRFRLTEEGRDRYEALKAEREKWERRK